MRRTVTKASQDLANALRSAQPKIQKMCEEESDDSEAVAKLLEINDSIHRTIERYTLVKKGDMDAAARIPQGTLGTSTGVSQNADNELSLIDLDGGEPSPSVTSKTRPDAAAQPRTESLEDDLLGLSFQDTPFGQGGGIALGFGANTSELIGQSPSPAAKARGARCAGTVIVIHLDIGELCETGCVQCGVPSTARLRRDKTQLRPFRIVR